MGKPQDSRLRIASPALRAAFDTSTGASHPTMRAKAQHAAKRASANTEIQIRTLTTPQTA